MRTISSQELKGIIDKHGKWLRNEEGGEKANLRSADLRYANLSSADLSYADLRYADLSYADLSSANLRSADLSSAYLRYANLSSADLSYADLRYADLRYADLSYADLSSANLRYANIAIFQFNRATAYFTIDGTIRIGCICMPISEWLLGYEEIGKKHSYSATEIRAYGNFIKNCAEIFEEMNPAPRNEE